MQETINTLLDWFNNETSLYFKALSLPVIISILYKIIISIKGRVQTYRDNKSLFPFYSRGVTDKARKDYIRTKCQNIDPSVEINLRSSFAFSAKEDLLNFFLKKVFKGNGVPNQFYLILGDSGMGKTTFILNLFSRYNSFLNSLLKVNCIKLLPLGIENIELKTRIESIQKPEKTILLLDGFDESPNFHNEDIKKEFDRLIDLTKDFKTVIITCRTHYFSSQNEEPNELQIKKFNTEGNGYHSIKKMYISPFDERDIKKYINKKFNLFQLKQKIKAKKIIKNTDDLLVRPMLLAYIKDLVKSDKDVYKTKTDIYEVMILAWLNRESNKYSEYERYQFKSHLAFFSYEITKYIYENYEKNGLFVPFEEIDKLSEELQIDLTKIELKSRSLLNRNSIGYYKFSHKSIYEFILAYLAYTSRRQSGNVIEIYYDLHEFDQALEFFEEMVSNSKVQFSLPEVSNRFEKTNNELVKRILQERNKRAPQNEKKVIWLTNKTYQAN